MTLKRSRRRNGPAPARTRMSPNVHRLERVASAAGAAAMLAACAAGGDERQGRGRFAPWVAGALLFRALTGYCPVYGLLGKGSRRTDTKQALAGPRGIHVRESITVLRRPHEVYALWRRLDNLPRYMAHLESVEEIDERRSHWVTKPVAGMRFEWDAEIVDDVEGEHIGWRSLEGADVVNAGSVHFKPAAGRRGTQVHVNLQYDPPAGRIGGALARLLGDDTASQIREDLRRFKKWIESGSPSTIDEPVDERMATGSLGDRVDQSPVR